MKAVVFVAIVAVASATSVRDVVDSLFDKHLPHKATWEEVKVCRAGCNGDMSCLAACPQFECPFQRITKQCDLFNSTVADQKACHHACGHDFKCHWTCPMAKPTSMKELQTFGEAMVCHTHCGHDHNCHKACHESSNPWGEKQARCEKLQEVVACMRNGGSHATCPHLDEETKTQLMQEPWSLVKDIGNHVADHLLPLPEGQEVSLEKVRTCHEQCGADILCHKNCPKGVFGRFHDQCDTLEEASMCHQSCKQSKTKCPFKKMECHFKCPMSMPTSVTELKGVTDHVLCHTTCGHDKKCHETCPNANWEQKKAHCTQYTEMVGCHKHCAGEHSCHKRCPQLSNEVLNEVKNAPNNVLKEILDTFVV